MMVELRNCYEANDGLTLESVNEGKFYVEKFQTDWYRYVTYHLAV